MKSLLARFVVAAGAALSALFAVSPGFAGQSEREEFYAIVNGHAMGGKSIASAPSDGPKALLVSGVIGPGSYAEFHAALSEARPDIVVIDGPGGVLGEAFLMGEEIRRRGLDTLVTAHRRCASACAVIFLSGHTRYLGAGAEIGLHSASYADGRTDPEATELMAEYLAEVGVPDATLRRMVHTAPKDIRWLTRSEQLAIGIRAFKPQS